MNHFDIKHSLFRVILFHAIDRISSLPEEDKITLLKVSGLTAEDVLGQCRDMLQKTRDGDKAYKAAILDGGAPNIDAPTDFSRVSVHDPSPAGTWCPQCGPDVKCDEDGCCIECGSTAVGDGAEVALQLTREREKIAMLIPVGMAVGPVLDDLKFYIKKLQMPPRFMGTPAHASCVYLANGTKIVVRRSPETTGPAWLEVVPQDVLRPAYNVKDGRMCFARVEDWNCNLPVGHKGPHQRP